MKALLRFLLLCVMCWDRGDSEAWNSLVEGDMERR